MNTQQTIQPLNVTGATLLVQLLLLAIFAITASLYRGVTDESGGRARLRDLPLSIHSRGPRATVLLFAALISFATLLISDELYGVWSPIFQGVGINTISSVVAINIVFILDLVLLSYLIWRTGGSLSSPFTAALFTIPALAIFLRIPPSAFITYAVVACVVYGICLAPILELDCLKRRGAAAFMNVACLFLSMFTGYITRPIPINQLSTAQSISSEAPVKSAPIEYPR